MNKLASILLSAIILLQTIGLHTDDLVQIDEFIEHAKFHSEQYGDNVLVFISKHYGELKAEHEQEHQEEKEDHEQLPFQHHSHLSSIIVYTQNPVNAELETPIITEYKDSNFYYQAPSSSSHTKGLLQPPRHS
ncbi:MULTISPECIES: hypothetical protein [Maribacter]|uniref:Uncharacterized protein n=1 Tax=Maribacter flavus TaxID=1658664 RepID=A0ABU7IIV3_9FLAO|nr:MULTISPECIES: hypothetical protein [Maribacter]MDC6405846.1 hypothetical protein [Maribacter sp. PR66]MEE1972902.1 hypothetical protein [Maribacter flavus]